MFLIINHIKIKNFELLKHLFIADLPLRLPASQLKEEGRQVQSVAAGLQAQLEDARHKVSHLERQLMERGTEFRELGSLRKELENLRTLTQNQEQQAAQSHREAQLSHAELASLEAILSLLHLREVERKTVTLLFVFSCHNDDMFIVVFHFRVLWAHCVSGPACFPQ